MPYRRLPNTDISRIKALKAAIEKSSDTDFQNVAVSMKTLSEAKRVVERFESLTDKYQQTFDTQVKSNIAFQSKVKSARLYISHFIQVLHLSVIRNEIKQEHLELYGLQNQNLLLPDLMTNEQILEWGEKIIAGEQKRISQGGVPIYNPGIARVNVMFMQFKEGLRTQKFHQNATNRIQAEVSGFRQEVDRIILDIWQEVEKFNDELPSSIKIERNKEYGLIYYYRKGETIE